MAYVRDQVTSRPGQFVTRLRRRASGAPAPGGVVPSERQWATQRPRRDEEGAPRTLERRAGRSSSPAGSRLSAMGGAAARQPRRCLYALSLVVVGWPY